MRKIIIKPIDIHQRPISPNAHDVYTNCRGRPSCLYLGSWWRFKEIPRDPKLSHLQLVSAVWKTHDDDRRFRNRVLSIILHIMHMNIDTNNCTYCSSFAFYTNSMKPRSSIKNVKQIG